MDKAKLLKEFEDYHLTPDMLWECYIEGMKDAAQIADDLTKIGEVYGYEIGDEIRGKFNEVKDE